MDNDERQRITFWRLGALGPLMTARLEHGDVSAYVRRAAERLHRMPDGLDVRLSQSTIRKVEGAAVAQAGRTAKPPRTPRICGMWRTVM